MSFDSRKGKTSGSEGGICFSCGVNEQTSDGIGQGARSAGLRVCQPAREKQEIYIRNQKPQFNALRFLISFVFFVILRIFP